MTSSTVEDYLKSLYLEQHMPARDGAVPTGRLASAMGVTPGTATTMIKSLAKAGLVRHESRQGVELTPQGESLALDVLRRHRLVEQFLVEVLGLDWSIVHEEAELLEHAVSHRVLDRMDAILGRPKVDPHGDPIPSGPSHVEQHAGLSLAEAAVGLDYRISRIVHQEESFLRFLAAHGLIPGTTVHILSSSQDADAVRIRANDADISMGLGPAGHILLAGGS